MVKLDYTTIHLSIAPSVGHMQKIVISFSIDYSVTTQNNYSLFSSFF